MLTRRAKFHKAILNSPIWIQRAINVLISYGTANLLARHFEIEKLGQLNVWLFIGITSTLLVLALELLTAKIYSLKKQKK